RARGTGATADGRAHEPILRGALFELLVVGPLDQPVDAPLAEKVRLALLRGAGLPVCGALVHPVDAVETLLAAGGLELALDFLLGALLLQLIDALLGALAFVECALFFFVYPFL